jgi:8-oxo-dGTP diphosphatase
MDKHVRVGVGCFVFNQNQEFIMIKRKGSHGAGTWALLGGHIEFGQTVAEAAFMEVRQEAGIDIEATHVRYGGWSEAIFLEEDKHYISVICAAYMQPHCEPKIMEPDKCEEIRWVKIDGPYPEPMFKPLARYLLYNQIPVPW